MNDFAAEPKELTDGMIEASARVIKSGWYVLGKEVESFEKSWAKICGVDYAVGVGNGMDAIEIGLRALNIGAGDEVITTPITAFATVLAIIRCGATPVLADIDQSTALLSLEAVRSCISQKTKAIILVHLYGQLKNMKAWQQLTNQYGIHLIEDCAQAHMAHSNGICAGSFGVIGAYSFYPTKNLGALGDAGMLVTQKEVIANSAIQLRNYGQSERYHHPVLGMNSRLDELQAAILKERLNYLPDFTDRRKRIANMYFSGIRNSLINLMDLPDEHDSHVYHLYVIRSKYRKELQSFLNANEIQSLIHYPVPIHFQEGSKLRVKIPNNLSNSEKYSQECLSIPCHPYMKNSDAIKIVDILNQFVNK